MRAERIGLGRGVKKGPKYSERIGKSAEQRKWSMTKQTIIGGTTKKARN